MKIQRFISDIAASVASLAKMVIMSRPVTTPAKKPSRPLIVLGNGPSLNDTIDNHADFMEDKDLLAVNFAANAPVFFSLKPSLYVLADPHFFESNDEKVAHLFENLKKADWRLSLYVPVKYKKKISSVFESKSNIEIGTFNMTPVEGFRFLENFAYKTGLGMPRPRNVLIPSIMIGLRNGYKEIYIAGADHSWSKTLRVDNQNRVVTVQPHFYADDSKEQARVTALYSDIRLHDIYLSFSIAFRSYFEIARYANKLGVKILNITPDSFIDAFPRLDLSTLH
ncbi:MAG: hypothetical protein NC201_04450 [Prevotella sp.]|nr:hypothetical protein [Bacteroides sp.]MCM1366480.1 hypothetical protein [Prevotella sp.]MCM1436819.1 hypothetical protein [Prevotella sp.]